MNKWFIIAAVVIVVAVATVVLKNKQKVKAFLHKEETVKFIAKLCVWAEGEIVGNKKGTERLNKVCEALSRWLQDKLPESLHKYITAEILEDTVTFVFEQIAKEIDGHRVAQE